MQIYTATHPMDAELRRKQEFGKPVTIGSDVWVGGGAIICPGVTIGSRTVIGAGSVVTRDIPERRLRGRQPVPGGEEAERVTFLEFNEELRYDHVRLAFAFRQGREREHPTGMKRLAKYLIVSIACSALAIACARKGEPPSANPDQASPGVDDESLRESYFEDVTAASGVNMTYRNGEEAGHLSLLEAMGGGVGLIDYDRDGLLDLFFTGGGYFDGPGKTEIKGHPCKLYRNLGGWRFEDVTAAVGLDHLAGGQPWFYTHGVAVADYDNDSWPDLLVTGWGRLALFHNETRCEGRPFVPGGDARSRIDRFALEH